MLVMMTSMMFVACSTSDDDSVKPTPTPTPTPPVTPTPTPENPFIGTWTLVGDADPMTVTELVMSYNPIIDYSATNTTVNPTIPAGTPTYVRTQKPNPNYADPWAGATTYSKEQGYFTLPIVTTTNAAGETVSTIPTTGKITFWPQSAMTSNDGSTWTATAAADMVKMEELDYMLNGSVMVLKRADKTTMTYIINNGTPATTVDGNTFFKTWQMPTDMDPATTVDLVMSATPYVDYTAQSTATNPTIPANAPSYTKTTKVDPTVIDPWGGTPSYTKVMGYFTLPGVTEGAIPATIPATGKITFWPQKQLTSTDGTTWTETPAAEMTVTMEEYTYTLDGNVMVLTRGDKTTETYFTIIIALR